MIYDSDINHVFTAIKSLYITPYITLSLSCYLHLVIAEE